MGGPWFTVQETGTWQTLSTLMISDGTREVSARVEVRITLEENSHD